MANKKQKYVVTQKHTLGHKVGATVSLTEKQAASLVNKVRLQAELNAASEPSAATKKLKTENEKLKAEIAELKKPAK